jgi:hypothetical protein
LERLSGRWRQAGPGERFQDSLLLKEGELVRTWPEKVSNSNRGGFLFDCDLEAGGVGVG